MPAKAKAKAPERDLFDEAGALVGSVGRDVPREFVRTLFGRVPEEDLAPYSPQALADLAATAYEHLSAPRPGTTAPICASIDREVERGGGRRDLTTLEVVNENRPFLLDPTLAELVEQGYEPRLAAYPIFAVERDARGALAAPRRRGRPRLPRVGAPARELPPHPPRPSRRPRRRARASIEGLTRGLCRRRPSPCATGRGMRARLAAIDRTPIGPRRRRCRTTRSPEAVAFLEWLADDNFTFLGMREYRLPDGRHAADRSRAGPWPPARPVRARAAARRASWSTMTPEIRAFLQGRRR